MRKLCRFFLLQAILLASALYGDNRSGMVTDCCGNPLSGVRVTATSTGAATTTDPDGKFSFDIASVQTSSDGFSVQRFSSVEVFDVHGRCIHRSERDNISNTVTLPEKLPQAFLIVRMKAPDKTIIRRMVSFRKKICRFAPRSRILTDAPLSKQLKSYDSLCFSLEGYSSQTIPAGLQPDINFNITLKSSTAPPGTCDDIRSHSRQALLTGEEALTDSLENSFAGWEWGSSGSTIPLTEGNASFKLKVLPVGLLTTGTVYGCSGDICFSRLFHAGYNRPEYLEAILTKRDGLGGVVLMEGTTIDESSYVMVYGRITRNNKRTLEYVHQRTDPRPSYPFDSTALLSFFNAQESAHSRTFADSTPPANEYLKLTDIGKTTITTVNGPVEINDDFSNMILRSADTVVVGPQTRLSSCQISAATLIIEGGVSDGCLFYSPGKIDILSGDHNSQFYSTDSIIIHSSVQTGPASVWVNRRTDSGQPVIHFKSNSSLYGTAISFADTGVSTDPTPIVLDSGSVFSGYIITDAYLSTQHVEIRGSVYVKGIKIKRGDMLYVNYLFGIEFIAAENPVLFPCIGKNTMGIQLQFETGMEICN